MMAKPLVLFLFLAPFSLLGQIGGDNVYEFLNLPPSARAAALGGMPIATYDDDPDLAYQNPSLLNKEMDNRIGMSTVAYLAGINYGYAGYAHHFDSIGMTFNLGIQYMAYGSFQRALANGEKAGSFGASEYAFQLGGAKTFDKITYGGAVKFITSQLETYHSIGIAADAAVSYNDTARLLTLTAVVKNIGQQLKTYRDDNKEPLPFDMQIGLSKRLEHLPFRFSVVYHHLQKWDIRYSDPNQAATTSLFDTDPVDTKNKKYTVDKFFRHTIFSGELTITKNVLARLAYNHQRRKEMIIDGRKGLTGFSLGASIRFNKFRIDYGRAMYHVAGASNHFSIQTDLGELF